MHLGGLSVCRRHDERKYPLSPRGNSRANVRYLNGLLEVSVVEQALRISYLLVLFSVMDPFRTSCSCTGARSTVYLVVVVFEGLAKSDLEGIFLSPELLRKVSGVRPNGEIRVC